MSYTVRQNAEVQNSIQPGRMKQTKGQETSCACVQKKIYLTESAELIMLAPLSPCNTHYTVSLPLLGIPTVPTRRPFTLPPIPGNTVVHYADISPCPMTPHLIQSAVDTRPSNMRRHADGWFISLFNLPRRFPPMGSIHRGELSLHVEFVRPAYCLPPGRQLAPLFYWPGSWLFGLCSISHQLLSPGTKIPSGSCSTSCSRSSWLFPECREAGDFS